MAEPMYIEFGDSPFMRTMAGVVTVVLLAAAAWRFVALPLLAWRRGRWPVDEIVFAPLAPDAELPVGVKVRIAALEPLGFTPRLIYARTEGGASATIVLLAHRTRDVVASVARFTVGAAALESTRITSRPGAPAMLSVVDAIAPSPFPARPGSRVLLFRNADAATLLAHFDRLHVASGPDSPMPDADLAAAMSSMAESNDRWLLEAGYLARTGNELEHRYTLKGGFSAALRPQWPWHALDQARLARNGRDALREASGGAA